MACSRPKRRHVPVRRYGFALDSEDDNSEGSDSELLVDDNASSCGSVEEDSDRESTDESSDSDRPTLPVAGDQRPDLWEFVSPETDPGPHVIEFNSDEGWNTHVPVPNEETQAAEDFIDLFFTEDLIQVLVSWTNEREARSTPEGIDLNITPLEMKKFLGLTFYMGLIKKPEIRDYWSTELLMSTPYFSHQNSLSRNRYIMILKFIRFNDPEAAEPNNKMSRIQGILDCLHNICKQWHPEQDLSIDETLLLFKGRLSCKQFIRIKRARFGVKSFVLTDASGYMLYFHPYVGAQTDLRIEDEAGVERFQLSKSEKIVVFLLEKADLLDRGHVISCDNWYCSVKLAEYLISRKTGMRGTIRSNRGPPRELVSCAVQKGDTKFMRRGPVLCMKYVDKKDVFLISTVEKAGFVEKTTVLPGNKRVVLQKPITVKNYNLKMNGVDLVDQIIAPYDCTRRSHVWFKKLGFNLLQRLLVNALIRFNHSTGIKITFKNFLKLTIVHFTGIRSDPSKSGATVRRSIEPVVQVQHRHSLTRIPESGKKKYPTKPCRVCSRQKRKESRYQCLGCPGGPGLCIENDCFEVFHST